jgi:hypothetical protein
MSLTKFLGNIMSRQMKWKRFYGKQKNRDPIPKHFKSIKDAAEFWDNHDLGDYWDLTREAHFEVDIKRRVFF